jgi:hypothetical protein
MKSISSIALVALCSALLAGCWFYSRPEGDPSAGCQKTTYGVAMATTSNTNCTPPTNPPPGNGPPPLPPPGQL